MAAEPAKLPLALRKEVRDNEEKKNKLLADAAATLGTAPTYNFDLATVYNQLATSKYQAQVVNVSLNYLDNTLKAVEKTYKDPLVKQEFDGAWTTHNIALVVVESDAEWEKVKADKATVGTTYYRLRLVDGELQISSSAKWFNSNIGEIASLDLTPLASQASSASASSTPGAEELPLELRVRMRDVQPKVDASLANIRKLKGLEDASFNTDAQTRLCYAAMKHITERNKDFSPTAFPEYLDQLHALLQKQWKDELVQEGLLEEWKAPHAIELRPETDIEKETGKLVKDGRYNAVKLDGGKLLLLQGKGLWRTNMNNIAGIDIVKML